MTKEVKVYTSTGCGPCFTLKKMLKDKGVEFEELQAHEHLDVLKEHNVKSVPFTLIDGEAVIGFKPEEIMEKLDG